MSEKELKKLVIETGVMLRLEVKDITKLDTAINLAYLSGWLDRGSQFMKDKSDIDLALENGASLDDMPNKTI